MGREGPCFHCGIDQTPLWRTGPPEKPVLCNACGSRWRIRGTLDDYFPKHANRETQSCHLPFEMKLNILARDDQKPEFGSEVAGLDGSSTFLEEEMNNISLLGSAGSSSDNCMQMEETNDKDPLWNPDSVPRKKRSELRQHMLSPIERFQRQLYSMLQDSDSDNISADDENILVYGENKNIPPNEIGLGAMLLVPATTATERTTSLSLIAEDNASCSTNVPLENPYLINDNVLDHVGMQNETIANKRGKAEGHGNRLPPHHTDTRSMASSQKYVGELYSKRARRGENIGHPVKRPRGRPRLSTTQGRCLNKYESSETADDSLQEWSSSLIDVPISSVNLNDSTGTLAINEMKVDTLPINMENDLN